jgi:hypothetical protein
MWTRANRRYRHMRHFAGLQLKDWNCDTGRAVSDILSVHTTATLMSQGKVVGK